MNMEHKKKSPSDTHFISAPINSDSTIPGAILGVEVGIDEQVIWVWTHLENGKSAVTGYEIKSTLE